jgi:ubiquinone/menaquinone biosynthesis C-methylase UbiE
MTDAPIPSIRRFVAEYRRVRLAEGFASADPRFAQRLPFRDATGRNASAWRIRALHYLLIRAGLALLPGVDRILDVGTGNGWLARRLAGSYRVTALDVDASDTGLAGLTDGRVSRVCGDLEALPLRDGSFDVVIAAATVHYSTRLAAALGEAARVLRRGGVLILADSPVYPDSEARDQAWIRTLSYYQSAGCPDLARRYRGLTRAELEQEKLFRFVTVSPELGRWKHALARLRGRRPAARLPVIFGWKV